MAEPRSEHRHLDRLSALGCVSCGKRSAQVRPQERDTARTAGDRRASLGVSVGSARPRISTRSRHSAVFWVESQENVNSCFLWGEEWGQDERCGSYFLLCCSVLKISYGHHHIPPPQILSVSLFLKGSVGASYPTSQNPQHQHHPVPSPYSSLIGCPQHVL